MLIIGWANWVIKIVWGRRSRNYFDERVLKAKLEEQNSFWANVGEFSSVLFALPGRLWITKSARLVSPVSAEKAEGFVLNLCNYLSENEAYQNWRHCFDEGRLSIFLSHLNDEASRYIQKKLLDLSLPVTGAHGDLHIENMGFTHDGEIKLFDWELFRSRGCLLVDLLAFRQREAIRCINPEGSGMDIRFSLCISEYIVKGLLPRIDPTQGAVLASLYWPCRAICNTQKRHAIRFNEFFKKAKMEGIV